MVYQSIYLSITTVLSLISKPLLHRVISPRMFVPLTVCKYGHSAFDIAYWFVQGILTMKPGDWHHSLCHLEIPRLILCERKWAVIGTCGSIQLQ